jgi:hypothetical protein
MSGPFSRLLESRHVVAPKIVAIVAPVMQKYDATN